MDKEKLLFANSRFYIMINHGDAEGVESLFAKDIPIQVVHPGRGPLTNRDAVLSSFRELCLAPPKIECLNPNGAVYGDLGVVTCVEKIGEGYLSASNIFVQEGDKWRLVAHHSGPVFDQDYLNTINVKDAEVTIN